MFRKCSKLNSRKEENNRESHKHHFVPKSFFFSKIWTSLESELTHHRYIISTYPLNLLSYKTVLYFIVAYIQKSQKMKVEINSMISMLYQMHNLHTIYKSS